MNTKVWIVIVVVFLTVSVAVDFYAVYLKHEQLRIEEEHIQKVHEENMMILNGIAKELKMIQDASKNDRN